MRVRRKAAPGSFTLYARKFAAVTPSKPGHTTAQALTRKTPAHVRASPATTTRLPPAVIPYVNTSPTVTAHPRAQLMVAVTGFPSIEMTPVSPPGAGAYAPLALNVQQAEFEN